MEAGDNTKEDIRRNLLVFSAAVVIYAWLGMPELSFLLKLLGIDRLEGNAQKLTVVAFGIQCYLMLRYWYSKQSQELISTYSADYRRLVKNGVLRYLAKEVAAFNDSGDQPAVIATSLRDHVAERMKVARNIVPEEYREFFKKGESPKGLITALHTNHPKGDFWSGELSMQTVFEKDGRRVNLQAGEPHAIFEIPVNDRSKIRSEALLRILNTPSSIEYATPVGLAVCAFGILVFRLFAR